MSCQRFFAWYNTEHHHAGLGLLTGAIVHYGDVRAVVAARQVVLGAAYAVHPERFVRQLPAPPALPSTGDRDLLYVAAQKLVAEHREEILNYVNRPAQ